MKRVFGFKSSSAGPVMDTRAGELLVNLGCGAHFHPDWCNVDFKALSPGVIEHDLRTPLPFETGTCRAIYVSHVLEHFSKRFAPSFLKECLRILIPGGVIRVAVPDLETLARLYLSNLEGALAGDAGAAKRYDWSVIELLDQMTRERTGGEMMDYWRQNPMPAEEFVLQRSGQEVARFLEFWRNSGAANGLGSAAGSTSEPSAEEVVRFRASGEVHKWMYDRYSLSVLLKEVGFAEVRQCLPQESRIPDFDRYGLDVNPDGSMRKPDSLFMEGIKD